MIPVRSICCAIKLWEIRSGMRIDAEVACLIMYGLTKCCVLINLELARSGLAAESEALMTA